MAKGAGIYMLTSPSGKSYIGKSIDLKKRLNIYKLNLCYNQPYILSSLKKYGFDNFIVEILYETNIKYKHIDNLLNVLEKYFIKKYDTFNNGYNLTKGGEGTSGRIVTEKSKEKYRETHKKNYIKENHPWFGKNHSEETKIKIGLKSIGRDNGQKGKIKTDEEKYKDIINQKTRKKIIQKDLDGNIINNFESIRQASKLTSISRTYIIKRCNGIVTKYNKHKFTFEYEEE